MRVRCSHCHNAIEIVGEHDLKGIVCSSCGSTFNLCPTTLERPVKARSIGHFQLIEELGVGAFGSVWKAKDTKLDRLVAVKLPRREQVERGNVEMFLREARAAAQLRHPGIVAVHEVGCDNDTLYIVSDLIEGVSLADLLTKGSMVPLQAAELLAQIAEALHHAHEAGVIHRDLKPSNIMLDAARNPHILDFGLAKREAGEITMTLEGRVLGTAAYMSPEQARGEGHRVDRRTDVYSLGVILFEMLTGERPFRGNVRMLLHQVIHDEPASPKNLNNSVSRDLETICLKCLEKDRRRRYATAGEVSSELRRHLAGHPIHARPVTGLERATRWCRRNREMAALVGVVVTLSTVAIVSSVGWFRVSGAAKELASPPPVARPSPAQVQGLGNFAEQISNFMESEELGNSIAVGDFIAPPRLQLSGGQRLREAIKTAFEKRGISVRSDAPVQLMGTFSAHNRLAPNPDAFEFAGVRLRAEVLDQKDEVLQSFNALIFDPSLMEFLQATTDSPQSPGLHGTQHLDDRTEQ